MSKAAAKKAGKAGKGRAARSGKGRVAAKPGATRRVVDPSETTIRLASLDTIDDMNKTLTRLEKDQAGVQSDFAKAWKDHEKKHVHKKALSDARTVAKMSDGKLAVYYAHLLHCFDKLGITDRATRQLDMFKNAVAVDKAKTAAEAFGATSDGEVRSGKAVPRAAENGEVKVSPAIEAIKRKLAAGEFVSQDEREKLAASDFDDPLSRVGRGPVGSAQVGPSDAKH